MPSSPSPDAAALQGMSMALSNTRVRRRSIGLVELSKVGVAPHDLQPDGVCRTPWRAQAVAHASGAGGGGGGSSGGGAPLAARQQPEACHHAGRVVRAAPERIQASAQLLLFDGRGGAHTGVHEEALSSLRRAHLRVQAQDVQAGAHEQGREPQQQTWRVLRADADDLPLVWHLIRGVVANDLRGDLQAPQHGAQLDLHGAGVLCLNRQLGNHGEVAVQLHHARGGDAAAVPGHDPGDVVDDAEAVRADDGEHQGHCILVVHLVVQGDLQPLGRSGLVRNPILGKLAVQLRGGQDECAEASEAAAVEATSFDDRQLTNGLRTSEQLLDEAFGCKHQRVVKQHVQVRHERRAFCACQHLQLRI
mmetsp:Transcript_2323/g.6596  ORF Transcript_2323/g.6596 Transcript_2323/m.6596 type:complete len:362 (-) Transcript_2323:1770-2855(-)